MRTYTPHLWQAGIRLALVESEVDAEDSLADVIAMKATSDKPSEAYVWLSDAWQMELLADELVIRGLTSMSYEIANNTYAIGMKIHRDHLKDDQFGLQMERARNMMGVARNFPNKLMVEALINGTSLLGYDGVSFFNDAHPARGLGTAYDNLLGGTGVTVAAIRTDIAAVFVAAMGVKNEAAEPFGGSRRSWTFVVPPSMIVDFNEALNAQIISNTSNVRFSGFNFNVISSPRLIDANDWYALDTSGRRKPIIYQEHSPLETEMLGPNSDHYVKNEEVLVKVRWRGGVGYNHPALAFKIVNT